MLLHYVVIAGNWLSLRIRNGKLVLTPLHSPFEFVMNSLSEHLCQKTSIYQNHILWPDNTAVNKLIQLTVKK